MKYFVIFLVLIGFVGSAFTLDDETLYLTGISLEEHYEIEILGLEDEYMIGEKYSFYFVISGYGHSCANHQASYPDENGNIMHMGAEVLCAPEKSMHKFKINSFEQRGTFGNIGIKNPGTYTVTVTFEKPSKYYPTTISKEFHVVDSVQEKIMPPPLKQIKSGIPVDEIQCKDDLVQVFKKSDNSPACVTLQTKAKLIQRGWAEPLGNIIKQRSAQPEPESNLEINRSCMTLEQSKDVAPFFKVPSYLPEGYSMKCSMSGMPSESYIMYHNKDVSGGWMARLHMLVDDGAIFIYQYDEKNLKKFETFGSPEQRIHETYDDVMVKNPSLQPQLIRINGILAYGVDSCPDCGIQTANFTDGTFIQKSTSTETKIKFYDEYGISYMLKTTLSLDELILVAESLQ